MAQAQQKVDDGEQSRMAALGEIFMTLRSALEAKDSSLLAEPGSPLMELAQAFDSWLKANLPGSDGNMDTHAAAWNRDKPFADPEEVFLVRW